MFPYCSRPLLAVGGGGGRLGGCHTCRGTAGDPKNPLIFGTARIGARQLTGVTLGGVALVAWTTKEKPGANWCKSKCLTESSATVPEQRIGGYCVHPVAAMFSDAHWP